jgi:hypothetical protein
LAGIDQGQLHQTRLFPFNLPMRIDTQSRSPVAQRQHARRTICQAASFVGRRKGELTATAIDRGWPHQVALPATECRGSHGRFVDAFCFDLTVCERHHNVFHEDKWWIVYCFADPEHAEKFRVRFGGERFDPKDRGRGASWARWYKTER